MYSLRLESGTAPWPPCASLSSASEHPLAQAIVNAARERDLSMSVVTEFQVVPGEGAVASIAGRRLAIGNARLMDREHVVSDGLAGRATELAHPGRTAVQVACYGKAAGIIAIADSPRETAKQAVDALRQQGVRPVMLTGDSRATVQRVAAEVGIDEVIAEVLPSDKAASTPPMWSSCAPTPSTLRPPSK